MSFTTLNLPRLAIEAKKEATNELKTEGYHVIYNDKAIEDLTLQIFFDKVNKYSIIIAEQLKERYEFQKTAYAKQFPFMMRNNIWKGGESLNYHVKVENILSTGTLGIGFIGGHNALVALTGHGHGDSRKSDEILYMTLNIMNDVAKEYKEKYNLNYAILATPAEGLSGRFTALDVEKFGIIENVNDREYYVNSFHVDVKTELPALKKIEIEGKYHELTKGGHITYVELDGEAKKNPIVILQLVKAMKDNNIGYGSINHPIDRCKECSFTGLIEQECPKCGSKEISRTRRITGYLVGDMDSWNSAKKAEEKDRVKHI